MTTRQIVINVPESVLQTFLFLVRIAWLQIVEAQSIPPELTTLDLGMGELAALALALETPNRIVLLDDGLARRTAQSSGLTVWGTLRVL